jgi:thymidylate synthase (FAD)
MKVIKSSAVIEYPSNPMDGMLKTMYLESAGRTCYKSETSITEDSSQKFVKMILDRGHESVIEHASASVRFICNRGCSHEIVRHRLASYSQESTRYCNYSKEKHGSEITVIDPRPCLPDDCYYPWRLAMEHAEHIYFTLLNHRVKPQIARGVLPIDLKTELVMTANLREWRHFFKLRTTKAAHPQLRQITQPLLEDFRALFPIVFDDVGSISDNPV